LPVIVLIAHGICASSRQKHQPLERMDATKEYWVGAFRDHANVMADEGFRGWPPTISGCSQFTIIA